MVDMSENAEATLVLAGTIGTAATTYIATLPIPVEIKIPTITLTGTISAALLAFWKTKVNKPKA
jgi:hypothetical protein